MSPGLYLGQSLQIIENRVDTVQCQCLTTDWVHMDWLYLYIVVLSLIILAFHRDND